MRSLQTPTPPHLTVVTILCDGGPYREGDACSLAFGDATIGRLIAHRSWVEIPSPPAEALVPDSVIARLERAAGPYEAGTRVALAFVDPTLVRIAPVYDRANDEVPRLRDVIRALPASESTETMAEAERPRGAFADPQPSLDEVWGNARSGPTAIEPVDESERVASGVEVELEWTTERVRRFVTVVDKLFTVERLGWYRHVFAMRLLLPDGIVCGDAVCDVEAMLHLNALRTALADTLGHPLLAAFMPNFAVTPEWLERIDSPSAVRAVAELRATIAPFVVADTGPVHPRADSRRTVGRIALDDFASASPSSLETLLPIFVPSRACATGLDERFDAYRRALIDAFGQTATAGTAVRLGRMTEQNCALDDRLWHLVGAIGEAFPDRADVA